MAYTPAKLLPFSMTNNGVNATYDYDDGSGDPWIGYPYKWNVTLSITAQPHSNPNSSPTPFFWDGNNVNIGDWIFTSSDGFTLKIVEISSQDSGTVVCVLEDVGRQNIFQDPTQSGSSIGPDGLGYLFSVNQNGMPILYPMPDVLAGSLSPQFFSNLYSRFMYDNSTTDIAIDQVAHGFNSGDIVRLDSSGSYVLAQADSEANSTVAGFVSLTGVPGPDRFSFTPIGPVVTHAMPSGNPGDIVYLSDTVAGGLTLTPPVNPVKMFIRIDSTTGIYIGGKSILSTGGGGGSGAQGATGPQGFNGSDGFQGATGSNGSNGVQGTTGSNGTDGFQGTSGSDGVQGATGTNGFQGAVGATGSGVQGPTGDTGATGDVGPTGPTGPSSSLQSYFAQKVGGGSTGPVWVIATDSGVEYDKPSAGHLTINIPSGVEISSAKLNLDAADLGTLDTVPYAIEILIRYEDHSRNTTADNCSYPTVTIIDKSTIDVGETEPTLATPFQYKTIQNSLSAQIISITDNEGGGEAVLRVQQLNFTHCTLVLNF